MFRPHLVEADAYVPISFQLDVCFYLVLERGIGSLEPLQVPLVEVLDLLELRVQDEADLWIEGVARLKVLCLYVLKLSHLLLLINLYTQVEEL